MKFFAKLVVGVLGLVLGAAPLLAAIPCVNGAPAMAHCAGCCGKMAQSAMTMTSPMDAVQAPVSQELSAPPCCTISSDETAVSAIASEAQRPVTQAVAQAVDSMHLANFVPNLPRCVRPMPSPLVNSRPQSTLCTFLI